MGIFGTSKVGVKLAETVIFCYLGAGGRWFDSSLTDQQIQALTVNSVGAFLLAFKMVVL